MLSITVNGHEIPAVTCENCAGTGIARTAQSWRYTSHIDDTVKIVDIKPGDRCPSCVGRGLVGSIAKRSVGDEE